MKLARSIIKPGDTTTPYKKIYQATDALLEIHVTKLEVFIMVNIKCAR